MKNSANLKFVSLTLALAAVWGTESTSADFVGYTLTLTEYSSTLLTAQYNGIGGDAAWTVMNTGTDTWTVSVTPAPQGISLNPSFIFDWIEPENSTEVNEVAHGVAFGNSANIYVTSDESILGYGGGPVTTFNNNTSSFPFSIGVDFDSTPIYVVFNDVAQGAEAGSVPDRASTLTLFSLSLTGLLGLRRFRIRQRA